MNPAYLALGNQLLQNVANPFYGVITTAGSPLSQQTITYNRLLRPFPQYDGVSTFRKPRAVSIYHGMTIRIDKRFSKSLTFLAAFTGGKSMDNSAAAVSYLGTITRHARISTTIVWNGRSRRWMYRGGWSEVSSTIYRLAEIRDSFATRRALQISWWVAGRSMGFSPGRPALQSCFQKP
jgi:hypothetical protein